MYDLIIGLEEGFYNIYGSPQVGKTVTSWTLASENEDWVYYPWPSSDPTEGQRVLIDHVAATRYASRTVRQTITYDNADVVVAVSREPLPEVHDSFKLKEEDTID